MGHVDAWLFILLTWLLPGLDGNQLGEQEFLTGLPRFRWMGKVSVAQNLPAQTEGGGKGVGGNVCKKKELIRWFFIQSERKQWLPPHPSIPYLLSNPTQANLDLGALTMVDSSLCPAPNTLTDSQTPPSSLCNGEASLPQGEGAPGTVVKEKQSEFWRQHWRDGQMGAGELVSPSRIFWPNFWLLFLSVSLDFALCFLFRFWNTPPPHCSCLPYLRIGLLAKISLSPQNECSLPFPGPSQTRAGRWKIWAIDFTLFPAAFSFQLLYCKQMSFLGIFSVLIF